MCQVKNVPVEVRYNNPHFSNGVDLCMVDAITELNKKEYLITVASCCGHGDDDKIPYLTTVQPKNKLKEVRDIIADMLGWECVKVFIWKDMPSKIKDQMGTSFLEDKVHVGYYNCPDMNDVISMKDEEEWFIDEGI